MVFSYRSFEVQRAPTPGQKFLCHCSHASRAVAGHHAPPNSAIFRKILPDRESEAADLPICVKYAPPGSFMRPHALPQASAINLTLPRAVNAASRAIQVL
jgi:hypothetical protein